MQNMLFLKVENLQIIPVFIPFKPEMSGFSGESLYRGLLYFWYPECTDGQLFQL